jgi:hypothetical protein
MTHTETQSTHLAKDQMLVWQGGRGHILEVLHGRVWLTASNCLDDHFLGAGARLTLPAHTRVVVSGESPALVRIAPAPSRLVVLVRQWLAPRFHGKAQVQPTLSI